MSLLTHSSGVLVDVHAADCLTMLVCMKIGVSMYVTYCRCETWMQLVHSFLVYVCTAAIAQCTDLQAQLSVNAVLDHMLIRLPTGKLKCSAR